MDEIAIIIDNGSGLVKAGITSDELPSVVFPSIVGKPRSTVQVLGGGTLQDIYVGDEAQQNRGILDLSYVLNHGVIQDRSDMQAIWDYTFSRLVEEHQVDYTEHNVMLTEPPMNPTKNREVMAQTMFEHFMVPGLSIQIQAVLSLFAADRTTGLVVDSGDGVTHVIPVWESKLRDQQAIQRVDIAGHDITDYLSRIVLDRGYNYLQNDAGREICRDIKEKLAYIATDFEKAMQDYKANNETVDKQYTLPDGKVITLGSERFRAPEILFNPTLIGKDHADAIHQLCITAVDKSQIDFRSDLLNNVVLSGGTSMLPGLKDRLQKELDALAAKLFGPTTKSKVITTEDRKFGVWIGGMKMASMATFANKWITREAYEEDPNIIHKDR